jgi:hypothetical protein
MLCRRFDDENFTSYFGRIMQLKDISWKIFTIIDEIQLFSSNKMIIACDSGAKDDNIGSFGISVSKGHTIVARINEKIPSMYGLLTSYRSECSGILGTLQFTQLLHDYAVTNNLHMNETITIICDNKSTVKTVINMLRFKITLKQYYSLDIDILLEIIQIINNLKSNNIKIILEHIESHQDRTTNELSYKAVLNIDADRLATKGLTLSETNYKMYSSSKAMLYIDNKPVTANHRQNLRDAYHSIQLNEYFWKKYQWSELDVKDIWWSIHGKSMSCFTLDQQTTLNKYIHRRLPCNQRENLYYSYNEAVCYNCKNEVETQDHMIQCIEGEDRIKLKKKYLRDLTILLINNDTDDTVLRIINECIHEWIHNKEIPPLDEITDNPSIR